MASKVSRGRPRGHIRRRGNSYQVQVYGGRDPLTGRELRLSESTTDQAEARRLLKRLCAQVEEQNHARTKVTFRAAMEAWLGVHEIEDSTRDSYEIYARRYIYPALGEEPIGKITTRLLEEFYAELRRCRARCNGTVGVDHRVEGPHECRTVRHRRPPGRPPAGGHPEHDCEAAGCTVVECPPHVCRPLSSATIRRIHFAISATLTAAVRWEWITSNPASLAKKPRQPTPKPEPPSAGEAAKIIEAAWAEDESWGTLVWLVMITGMRRAEVLALRWSDVDLDSGMVSIRRNYVRAGGRTYEKDTKTHQMRRISLDPATVEVLRDHRERYEELMREVEAEPTQQAFLFSHESTCDRP